MIGTVLGNRFLTAEDLYNDENLNHNNVSVHTIRRMLNDEGLGAYKPKVIPLVSEPNKEKRLEFSRMTSRWTKKWERILFTDESWLCAEPYGLRYVRRFAGEELSEEYCIKKTKFNGNKKILVWAAISFDGPEELYFLEENENREVYEEILEECLPNIKRLQSGELIFQQDNATPH